MSAFGSLDLTATAGLDWKESSAKEIDSLSKTAQAVLAAGNTTINLNGNYSFRDREDIEYFMNRIELAVRRV